MKLMKRAERQITVWSMINTWKAVGCEVKGLGRYMKSKEVDGGHIGMHMDIHKVVDPFGQTGYTMSDTLGRICCQTQTDKAEIMNWLADNGWKPEKQWYLEDGGMDEETWEEWNRG